MFLAFYVPFMKEQKIKFQYKVFFNLEGDDGVLTGMDDAVVSASTIEHDSIMDLPEVLRSSFAPANSVGYEEASKLFLTWSSLNCLNFDI